MSGHTRPGLPRIALLASLGLLWLNFLLTSRWADVPGSLHGPKQWIFAALLAITTALALIERRPGPVALGREATIAALAAGAALVSIFFVWFPPATWTGLPFLDNWPARFQSTVEGLALLGRGTLAGWQWDYLGGYHSSSDLTVTLTIPAALPMLLFGDRIGFHLAHLLLFCALPALVWIDMRIGARRADHSDAALPPLAFALASASALAYSYVLLRSGDTNSLAGVAATLLALVGSHAAAGNRRWGAPVLAGGLTLVVYTHAGFLVYAAVLLLAESLFYRDVGRLRRALAALGVATVAGLPLTWESWRYPEYFTFNNVLYDTGAPIDWAAVLRKIYYNVEIQWLPGRWLNDSTGLTNVFLPLLLLVAAGPRTRPGFYAAGALAVVLLSKLNIPEFGYAFVRPLHLLGVLTTPALAAFIVHHTGRRALALALAATVVVYLQILVRPVPHVASVATYQPELVERLRGLDGALVLVENTFHRDMIAAPGAESDPTPFPAHFQSLLAAETGKRLYAGIWDGWQWSPYRGQLVAGGAWMGRAIEDWPHGEFMAELRRWGIRHLLVIHDRTRRYLDAPGFARHPDAGPYAHFELLEADVRTAVATTGAAVLAAHDPLGARIALTGVNEGDRVVVRTNYHPAWTATAGDGRRIALLDEHGQLAFDAPAGGSYEVVLEYPRRPWLWLVALTALATGIPVVRRIGGKNTGYR